MANLIKNRQFPLYTKTGAAQFKLQKIRDYMCDHRNDGQHTADCKYTEGWWLFVDAAKAKDGSDRQYDWDKKIVLRLGLPDIGVFLNGFRMGFKGVNPRKPTEPMEFKIYHDPNKGSAGEGQISKGMSIAPGSSYGFIFNFNQSMKGSSGEPEKRNVMVSVTDEQMIVLRVLLEQAACLIAGFYDDGPLPETPEKYSRS
jgi:hypothetical protein